MLYIDSQWWLLLQEHIYQVLTSLSPTITFNTRPRGTTCVRSAILSVSLLPLTTFTRMFSRVSGLKRPPARSLESSSFSCACALSIPACRPLKSNGSGESLSLLVCDCIGVSDRVIFPPRFCNDADETNDLNESGRVWYLHVGSKDRLQKYSWLVRLSYRGLPCSVVFMLVRS